MTSLRPAKAASNDRVVALALTWDGARWPVRSLPPRARAFLADKSRRQSTPSAKSVAKLLSDDQVEEIRVCWVPRLKGGDEVLSEPFQAEGGKRLAFRSVKITRLEDYLGVVYRR
jgi:hypothetical protein